jgi:hypothetical protein
VCQIDAPRLYIGLVLVLLLGCTRDAGDGGPLPSSSGPRDNMPDIQKDLDALGQARVYFNHQSVGFNILSGVERLGKIAITQAQLGEAAAFAHRGIVHTALGVNAEPLSKIDGFRQALTAMPEPPDVALMKFCYIDFDQGTDPEALFTRYKQTIDELSAKMPRTRFMHVTVPLVVGKPRWKRMVKDVLGRNDDSYANAKREAFSALLRKSYPADRVFDLARVESTRPDGSTEAFEREGRRIPALVADYSDDGAHLGPAGRNVAARAFVQKVAAVLRAP